MKQSKSSTKPQSSPKPLNPQQFPLHAQMDATAGRDKVREVVPACTASIEAPRGKNKVEPDWHLVSPCASAGKMAQAAVI